MIEMSIDFYRGDESGDEWLTEMDPYFIIKIDTDNDGDWDETYTSSVFWDDIIIYYPYSVEIDIEDGQQSIRFLIMVYDDDDFGSDQIIDYYPTSSYWYTHTVYAPYSESWSYDGSDDGTTDQMDCELDYSISIVS